MFEPFTLIYGKMGVTGVVLALFALTAATVFMAKLYQYWHMQLWKRQDIDQLLSNITTQQPQEALEQSRTPVAQLLGAASSTHHKGVKPEQIKDEMIRVGSQQLMRIESHFRILDVIANLSPLLGLLGTVLGMISAFTALEAAGMRVDPAVLSGGISLALLTTAAGLIIAIPTTAALNYLESIAQKQRHLLTDVTIQCMANFSQNISLPTAKFIKEHEHKRAVA